MSEVPLYGEGRVDDPISVNQPLQGYLAHKKAPPPPQDHPRPLGIRLLYGLRGRHFLMSEVPLYWEGRVDDRIPVNHPLQGYLAHKKAPPSHRTTIGS
jgi:hypothetical protein